MGDLSDEVDIHRPNNMAINEELLGSPSVSNKILKFCQSVRKTNIYFSNTKMCKCKQSNYISLKIIEFHFVSRLSMTRLWVKLGNLL